MTFIKLNDPTLLERRAYINGEWVTGAATYDVNDPSTGKLVAAVADLTTADTQAAIDAAYAAGPEWAALSGKERAVILRRWHDLMIEHTEDLATILTAEMGKPLHEARGEIHYGASFIEWFAEEAKRIYGDVIPGQSRDKRIVVLKQPIGVVGAITPWNFPNAMITRKVGPALAAGCTVVLRPASLTPLSALALAVLSERAGIPAGVLNVVTSTDSAGVGKEICSNPKVRKITFTGSTNVGKILMGHCAGTIKKMSLELGGNAPFIVFDDADVDAAVEGAMMSKFRNNGQTCVCANRLYVQSGVYDEFAEKLKARVQALNVGNGFDEGVTIGPMIDRKAVEKVESHIRDATENGAEIMTGGSLSNLGGTFFTPTVLRGVTRDMLVCKEETFGPLAALVRFDTEDEVVGMANDSEFGLASYFYSRDLMRVWRVAEALECGIVGVNTGIISTEVAPFGGVKESGIGREGSKYGIEEFLEIKNVCFGNIR